MEVLKLDGDPVRFVSSGRSGEFVKYVFASYLKKDYVGMSVVLYVDARSVIKKMFFTSRSGNAEWINGRGISGSYFWETEEMARSASYVSRRYTAILSDGPAGDGHAEETVIPEVIGRIENGAFADFIKGIVSRKRTSRVFRPERYGLVS